MGRKRILPVINQSDIDWLVNVEKTVRDPDRWREMLRPDREHPLFPAARLDLEDVPPGPIRGTLRIYARESRRGTRGDWSCGLLYTPYDSPHTYPLIRCNGPHPTSHTNEIEGDRIIATPHIHYLTQRYLELGDSNSGYAEPTDRYQTLDGAITTLRDMTNLVGTGTLFLP